MMLVTHDGDHLNVDDQFNGYQLLIISTQKKLNDIDSDSTIGRHHKVANITVAHRKILKFRG